MSIKDFHAQLNADEKASDMYTAMDQLATSGLPLEGETSPNVPGWDIWT